MCVGTSLSLCRIVTGLGKATNRGVALMSEIRQRGWAVWSRAVLHWGRYGQGHSPPQTLTLSHFKTI